MKKVATVLAVATVTMATTMDNFGDENLMINPYASKMPGSHMPIPQRDVYIRKPILDKVVAADEFGDDHFAVDDFGDDNFAVDEFGDDNFAVDDFGDENFMVEEGHKGGYHKKDKLKGISPAPKRPHERMYPKLHEKPTLEKVVAADELDNEFFAADDFGDDNFAVDDFGDEEFMAQHQKPFSRQELIDLHRNQSPEVLRAAKERLMGHTQFADDHFAVDDFGDDNFAVDEFGDDNFAVDDFGDENFMVKGGQHGGSHKKDKQDKQNKGNKGKKPHQPKEQLEAIPANEFFAEELGDDFYAVDAADEELWSRTDLPLHPVNRDRIKPMPWVRTQDKVVAADEFDNEFFAADDFGDDNFAVDNFGDEELFVGTGNPHVKLIKGDRKEHTKKPVEKAIAADEFADENFAVEFDDEEFMVRRPVNPHFDLHKAEGKEHKERKEHIKKPVEKVIAADELADDNYFVDEFGDDNFAVDLGDDYFAVDTFGDDNFAVDDFADENLAVEFGDDELVYTQGRLERPLPLRDPHTLSLRGGSLYQLDKLLREAH